MFKKILVGFGLMAAMGSTAYADNMPRAERKFAEVANKLQSDYAFVLSYDKAQTNDYKRIMPEFQKIYDSFFNPYRSFRVVAWTGSVLSVSANSEVIVMVRRLNMEIALKYQADNVPEFVKTMEAGDEITFSGTLSSVQADSRGIIHASVE